MNRKANPRLIGLFVLGAIALFVTALVALGSGFLRRDQAPAVIYFDGSVNGLYVGAPVNFRGVRVGSVTRVDLVIDSRDLTARIPTYIRFDPDRTKWTGLPNGKAPDISYSAMVERGLRAQLVYQSYVTQQLMVELDLLPDTPATLVGADPDVEEIPTVPSTLDVVRRNIEQLPIQDMVGTAMNTLSNVDRLLSSPDIGEALAAMAGGMREFETTMAAARSTFTTGSDTLAQVQKDLQSTMAELQGLIGTANREFVPLVTSLRTTSQSVEQAVSQAQTMLNNTNELVSRNSPIRSDLETSMRNLAVASRSLRGFAETLERNPNALLLGR
ncbi:MlaD family protein [Skermanella pratensis]|uniref:MlaD family protein n=1 Tax=Skermanella pratensis TaxID=2233999 RepID=UPI00130151CC|nr:MlaD family protein [Skermanella pratensis]